MAEGRRRPSPALRDCWFVHMYPPAMTTEANETPANRLPETLWCPDCQHQNAAAAGHCVQCGVSLSSRAATVAPRSLWAAGQIYRNAIEHPRSPVVVAGVWMLGVAAIASVGAALRRGLANPGVATLVGAICGAAAILWAAVLIAKATRNYLLARKRLSRTALR